MLARCRGVSPFIWYWQMFFFFVSEMSAPRLDFNNALTFFFSFCLVLRINIPTVFEENSDHLRVASL
jgi:hypothetical protein